MKTIIIVHQGNAVCISESVANKLHLKNGQVIESREKFLTILDVNILYTISYVNTELNLLSRQN